ncbi:hypothetical protein GC197_18360 [bacterium]|nr:hypothetical protein [bacterium]
MDKHWDTAFYVAGGIGVGAGLAAGGFWVFGGGTFLGVSFASASAGLAGTLSSIGATANTWYLRAEIYSATTSGRTFIFTIGSYLFLNDWWDREEKYGADDVLESYVLDYSDPALIPFITSQMQLQMGVEAIMAEAAAAEEAAIVEAGAAEVGEAAGISELYGSHRLTLPPGSPERAQVLKEISDLKAAFRARNGTFVPALNEAPVDPENGRRIFGLYNSATNTITFYEGFDLSTMAHELLHFRQAVLTNRLGGNLARNRAEKLILENQVEDWLFDWGFTPRFN